MASAEPLSEAHDIFSQFERIRRKIRDKFSRTHFLLQEREAALLAEVQELEDRYRGRGITDEMKELTLSKEHLRNTLKGNKSQSILQQSIAPLDQRISELKKSLERAQEMESVDLEWNEDFEDELRGLGAIRVNGEKSRELVPDYKKKRTPLAYFGKHKTVTSEDPGVFGYPGGVTMDTKSNCLYICDGGNNRVQVFDKIFQFLFVFAEKMDGPHGIHVYETKVYVTQARGNCLNIYSLQGKLINSVGKKGSGELEFDYPTGLAISTEWKMIYICEFNNDHVQCLNLDLTFNSFISDIFGASVVKLTPEEIVVLCCKNPCIRIYNKSHQLSRQLISRGEDSTHQVSRPTFFHLDSSFNILITDYNRHCVSIYSYTGALIHRFGKEGEEKGDLIQPGGIMVDNEGRIIVASCNPNHSIQIF